MAFLLGGESVISTCPRTCSDFRNKTPQRETGRKKARILHGFSRYAQNDPLGKIQSVLGRKNDDSGSDPLRVSKLGKEHPELG
ncbi:MAG: hypothetical protein K8U03_22455 [Planctomycetia bacterium]|nr:hypothetical protein [Planctomycetia bacterium]